MALQIFENWLLCSTLFCAVGLFAPLLSQKAANAIGSLSRFSLWLAAAILLVAVAQNLAALVMLNLSQFANNLPPTPMTMLIEVFTPAPHRALGGDGISLGWWTEELRALAALVIALSILPLANGRNQLAVNVLRKLERGRARRVRDIIGALFLTLPVGLLLIETGWRAGVRSIVSPKRNLEQWPPLAEWHWEAPSSWVGWGHPWLYDAIVLFIGAMVVLAACQAVLKNLSDLRLPRVSSAR